MNNQFFCVQNYECIYMKYIYRERESKKKEIFQHIKDA